MLGTASIGLPVVLWLFAVSSTADSANTRSIGNAADVEKQEKRLDALEQSKARNDERFKAIMASLARIESKVEGK